MKKFLNNDMTPIYCDKRSFFFFVCLFVLFCFVLFFCILSSWNLCSLSVTDKDTNRLFHGLCMEPFGVWNSYKLEQLLLLRRWKVLAEWLASGPLNELGSALQLPHGAADCLQMATDTGGGVPTWLLDCKESITRSKVRCLALQYKHWMFPHNTNRMKYSRLSVCHRRVIQ